MISSFGMIQNAVLAQNIASTKMVQNSNRMLANISFGNSTPLRPSFSSDYFELQNKANETKMTVWQKLMEAYEKKIAKDIDRSTPKFGGVNYIA